MTAERPVERDIALRLDPVRFARACGVAPYPWQEAALRSRDPRECWVCSRQSGKTTTAALLAAHAICYGPAGSTVVSVSVGQRQATELVMRAKAFYRLLGQPRGAASDREGSLTTEEGSRLVSLPGGGEGGATIRGLSASVLLLDEASRIDDSVYAAVRPFVAVTGGRVILLSTPWTELGFFAAAALGRDPGWTVRRVDAAEVLDPGFLADERASMTSTDYDREYGIDFAATVRSMWSEEQWAALEDPGAPVMPRIEMTGGR